MKAIKEAVQKLKTMGSLPASLQSMLESALREDEARKLCDCSHGRLPCTCKTAEQRQGEPVTLPERKPWNGLLPTAENLKGEGWNACLDEIAKLGPLYAHADPAEVVSRLKELVGTAANDERIALRAEVERLRDQLAAWQALAAERLEVATGLRTQLAEAHALLDRVVDHAKFWHDHPYAEVIQVVAEDYKALSASAEPSAPAEIDHDALVAAFCVLRSQGLGNLSQAVEVARAALERKP